MEVSIFHKITDIKILPNYMLLARFEDKSTKEYDLKPIISKFPQFEQVKSNNLFQLAKVDVGGYGIVWNDELDLSCDEIWSNGIDCAKEK